MLDDLIKKLEQRTDSQLELLRRQAQQTLEDHANEFDALLARHGVVRCQQCNGTGAVQRLDAGYMRRFGLREWNGCEACGSTTQDEKGRGYVPKKS